MNIKTHPIFWSIIFALLSFFIVTIVVAELLSSVIAFSLFCALPSGLICALIVLIVLFLYIKK